MPERDEDFEVINTRPGYVNQKTCPKHFAFLTEAATFEDQIRRLQTYQNLMYDACPDCSPAYDAEIEL